MSKIVILVSTLQLISVFFWMAYHTKYKINDVAFLSQTKKKIFWFCDMGRHSWE